jgi:hypothetical protein
VGACHKKQHLHEDYYEQSHADSAFHLIFIDFVAACKNGYPYETAGHPY